MEQKYNSIKRGIAALAVGTFLLGSGLEARAQVDYGTAAWSVGEIRRSKGDGIGLRFLQQAYESADAYDQAKDGAKKALQEQEAQRIQNQAAQKNSQNTYTSRDSKEDYRESLGKALDGIFNSQRKFKNAFKKGDRDSAKSYLDYEEGFVNEAEGYMKIWLKDGAQGKIGQLDFEGIQSFMGFLKSDIRYRKELIKERPGQNKEQKDSSQVAAKKE